MESQLSDGKALVSGYQHSLIPASLLVWCGSVERGRQLRRHPCHLNMPQNYEVHPKIVLAGNKAGGWRPLTSESCLAATYLQTHYGSNVAVVFDGYPSDVNGNSAKSAERIRRANLHSSHEIIFNEATCPETSQEQFLANERNKVRFIDLLKKFLQKANVTVKQAVEDADVLIVETAVSVKSQYDNIFVVGEGIDLLVLLTGLAPMKENLYFRKCGKGRTPDIQKWLGYEKNPLEWGWVPTRFGLFPRKIERDAAPESLLKIISCNCKKRCKNACGCRKAGLICSSLCTYSLGEACENVSDISLLEDRIEDEDDTPSSINNFTYEDI
ncbi:hypothetical protein AVEN_76939-1 [Araneus ventricosus]|uniref:Tesmin/TSO1-like CXC domain-containing protein n=1 Tax=Araneus ventricosus TaxID=182803 RepID=A0A4Y2FHI1_ARAVE|nr:hypothetical protein AVEN_76939-1 [Araneus ventricosus]